MTKLTLSILPKTWFIDIDGVLFIHNSHLDGEDVLVPGIMDFLKNIKQEDLVVLITARKEQYREVTEASLQKHGIRYDQIIFNMPVGERILINDEKPQGLKTSIAINTKRDVAPDVEIVIDPHI